MFTLDKSYRLFTHKKSNLNDNFKGKIFSFQLFLKQIIFIYMQDKIILSIMMNGKILVGFLVFVLAFSSITYASSQTSTIPSWVKNVAGFWSDGKISDAEFLAGIQYLIDHGMLSVSDENIKSKDTVSEIGKVPESVEQETQKEFSDLDLLTFKVTQLQEITSHLEIIQAVIDSNEKFEVMDDPIQYIVEKDAEWKNQPKNKNSPFMSTLIENPIAKILKTKSIISTEEFGDVLFPEIIVTNAYGANVAITIRTDDYNQGDEIWWIKAKENNVQFRDTTWDQSAGIYSADIIIAIFDNNGQFIGVLNAATPVK